MSEHDNRLSIIKDWRSRLWRLDPYTLEHIDWLISEVQRLRAELAETQCKLDVMTKQRADWQAVSEQNWQMYAAAKDELAAANKEIERLVSANEHWHTRMSQMIIQDKAALEKIDQLEGELAAASKKLEEAQERINQATLIILNRHSKMLDRNSTRLLVDVRAEDWLKGEH